MEGGRGRVGGDADADGITSRADQLRWDLGDDVAAAQHLVSVGASCCGPGRSNSHRPHGGEGLVLVPHDVQFLLHARDIGVCYRTDQFMQQACVCIPDLHRLFEFKFFEKYEKPAQVRMKKSILAMNRRSAGLRSKLSHSSSRTRRRSGFRFSPHCCSSSSIGEGGEGETAVAATSLVARGVAMTLGCRGKGWG